MERRSWANALDGRPSAGAHSTTSEPIAVRAIRVADRRPFVKLATSVSCPDRTRAALIGKKHACIGGLTRVRILRLAGKKRFLPPLLNPGVGVQYADKTLTCRDC